MKPCVYVGMTGIPVDHRFENHKNGYKSAWVVRKYGVRLMPELYEHLNPMPFEAALQMETELAEDLRASGYTVTGGHCTREGVRKFPAPSRCKTDYAKRQCSVPGGTAFNGDASGQEQNRSQAQSTQP